MLISCRFIFGFHTATWASPHVVMFDDIIISVVYIAIISIINFEFVIAGRTETGIASLASPAVEDIGRKVTIDLGTIVNVEGREALNVFFLGMGETVCEYRLIY